MATETPSDIIDEEEYTEEELSEDIMTVLDQSTEEGMEEEDSDFYWDQKYPKIGESEEDAEQKEKYMEYLQVIKEIEAQNKLLEDMKERILDLCPIVCKTACDEKNIRDTRTAMENENLKLKCLINKAIQLQNFGPHRRWEEIPITTTFDEDNLKPYVHCTSPNKYAPKDTLYENTCSSETSSQQLAAICQDVYRKNVKNKAQPVCSERDSEDEHVREILCGLKKLKITCPEDKKMLCDIVQALKRKLPKPCPPMSPHPCPKHSYKRNKPVVCNKDDYTLINLKEKVCGMKRAVDRIQNEIERRQHKENHKGRVCSCAAEPDAILECGGKLNAKSEQIAKLKENYYHLLTEYARKEAELEAFKSRTGNVMHGAAQDGGSKSGTEDTELCLLRARVNELKEEQQEFKCIMKEQATQLEDYRHKYISAQQKVEEQCVLLEKLNMNNKRIEKQINCEVKEIRDKFQEKLKEFLHYPKMLENEQIKVADLTKSKDELEQKLLLVCKELCAERTNKAPKETQDLGPQLAQCQAQCEEMQKQLCQMQQQRDLYCEQLRRTQDDLDTLRSESAKIIARTKERTELIRQQQQECINKLEKDLAQCRATACLSVSDREAVIREMQGQLNALAFSFDSAQKQIKTLRNHIAYVSNENCYPVKC